ncbi:DUF262 domain-containing HNH endonuclease family protein [Mycoplasma sp. CSL7475-4]|uniref:DUF262 domain-containing protein n=1 Tax=Mycoplasma sp. CSL7475-4 TaxID=2973942 RepID=UPI00216AD93A|nr:DUF262 domain-containing HNH endonuclease family protein [Mycoplasma sp. CSL7475-4]MCS4536789.1 DUF262 domain-containing HNH endonuclease family protein [Mycoplasma sp. CSL7475-4]
MKDLTCLFDLFDKKIFRIPDYQRGYAWNESQLNDFWDDLIYLNKDKFHYTGMISLKKLDKDVYNNWKEEKWIFDERSYEAYHVVDGQQRLTTLVILINCIIKFANHKNINFLNGVDLEEIKNRYIVEYKKPEKILKAYKFGYETDNPSFEFLRYKILEENHPGSLLETFYTLNLEKANQYFTKKIQDLFKNQEREGLELLLDKVCNKLLFNIYYIDDNFDVYTAFETMNNRGKKLSNLEILKNRLIYLTTIFPDRTISIETKNQIRRNINESWKEIYYQLGRDKNKPLDDDEYLKNHWSMYFKYSRNKGNAYIDFLFGKYFNSKSVYKAKSKTTDDNDLTIEKINNYVESLKSVAKYWYYSFNPEKNEYEFSKDEIQWINKLNRIDINYFRTLVVASFLNKKIDESRRIKLFKTIEKFIFLCFRLGRIQSTYLSSKSYAFAEQLMKGTIEIEEIIEYFEKKFKEKEKEATNSFAERVRSSFDNDQEKGYYGWKYLSYFLFEYEMKLYSEKGHSPKLLDWSEFTKSERDKISIEHIFPQTPTKWYWRNQFRNYNDDEKRCLSNSLGNLIALSQKINSELQNNEFEYKKEKYSTGCISELEIAKHDDWNPNTILDRGKKLLKFMQNRWGFTFSQDEETLLGLTFMNDERESKPEITQDSDFKISQLEKDDQELNYFADKNQNMVELYEMLFTSIKEKYKDLSAVQTNWCVTLKDEKQAKTIANINILRSKLKIMGV